MHVGSCMMTMARGSESPAKDIVPSGKLTVCY